MKNAKLIAAIAPLALASALNAQVFKLTPTGVTPTGDGSILPTYQQAVNMSGASTLTGPLWYSLSVDLKTIGVFYDEVLNPLPENSGGRVGDLVALLTAIDPNTGNSLGSATLINRIGKTATDVNGYQNPGLNITLNDAITAPDIHLFGSTFTTKDVITGTYNSDGRSTFGGNVTDQSPRDNTLGAMHLQNVNVTWSLYLQDMVDGTGLNKVQSWNITFTAVPEPQHYAMILGIGLMGFAAYRRLAVKKA